MIENEATVHNEPLGLQGYADKVKEMKRLAVVLKELYEKLPQDIQDTTLRPLEILRQLGPICRCNRD
jgi:hypothetical protein